MPRVLRTPEALTDLRAIVSYIAQDNSSAASKWLEEIEYLFAILATQPKIGERVRTKRLGRVRRVSRQQYVVYYKSLSDGVEILRVIHGARDHKRIT
jgi:toxin ParE1/3/4